MLKRYKRVLAVLAGTTMIVSSMTACGSGGDTKAPVQIQNILN